MRYLPFLGTLPVFFVILCGITFCKQPSETKASVDLPVMQNDISSFGGNTLDCGLHALFAASILVEREIPFKSLFGDLSLTQCHLILPLRMERSSQNLHWVTLCEVLPDGFIFFDSIDAHLKLTKCEVDSLWDGQEILIGNSRKTVDDSANLLWLSGFSRKVLLMSVVQGFVFASNKVSWLRRSKTIVLVSVCTVMYTVAVCMVLIRGDSISCGCFGTYSSVVSPIHVVGNLGLLLMGGTFLVRQLFNFRSEK